MIITPEFIADLARWNRANRRARREYRIHKFSGSHHNATCASAGCPSGLKQQRRLGRA